MHTQKELGLVVLLYTEIFQEQVALFQSQTEARGSCLDHSHSVLSCY